MHEKNNNKTRASIALFLCFCVVALTSFIAVKSSLDKINNLSSAPSDTQTPVPENSEASARTPVVDSHDNGNTNTGTHGTPSPEDEELSDYTAPVTGHVQLKYSMDSLVYSKTLDQYMTHPGVDISAAPSTEVSAIADGTVSKVYNDDRYGVTVHISHGDGLTSIYSNLAEQGLTETGNEVKQGDIIGSVGDTALFESLDETHLHFAMTKDSNPVDPGEYIDTLKQ